MNKSTNEISINTTTNKVWFVEGEHVECREFENLPEALACAYDFIKEVDLGKVADEPYTREVDNHELCGEWIDIRKVRENSQEKIEVVFNGAFENSGHELVCFEQLLRMAGYGYNGDYFFEYFSEESKNRCIRDNVCDLLPTIDADDGKVDLWLVFPDEPSEFLSATGKELEGPRIKIGWAEADGIGDVRSEIQFSILNQYRFS